LLFGAVAQHLGYAEGDEGKVVARAADGDDERLLPVVRAALPDPDPGAAPALGMSPNAFIRAVRDEPPDDIAAALQRRAEELVAALVVEAHRKHGGSAIGLAGGVFANVAVNRAIAEAVPEVPVFVFPAMGDAGLCAGAAMAAAAALGVEPRPVPDIRLGPGAGAGRRSQGGADLDSLRDVLRGGGVLARCVGRMEFGPRALGARSLLFRGDEPARGAALNTALGRDPVMPFGPILPVEAASRYLHGWSAVLAPMTSFMTVALPATDELRRAAPAAVHRDGTARAQVLREDEDPALHRLLLSLEEPVLVNTSLNLHGEPIVATVEQAARTASAAGCAGTWFDL
jgi:carbamoyltransferase